MTQRLRSPFGMADLAMPYSLRGRHFAAGRPDRLRHRPGGHARPKSRSGFLHICTCGTLLEIASAADSARERLAGTAAEDRCTVLTHDMFEPFPVPDADVCLVVRLTHNWNDEDAVRLLRTCADAVGEDGRVLLAERPVSDGGAAAPDPRTAIDLLMLVSLGGRERTVVELHELISAVGMEGREAAHLPSGWSLIECRRNRSSPNGTHLPDTTQPPAARL